MGFAQWSPPQKPAHILLAPSQSAPLRASSSVWRWTGVPVWCIFGPKRKVAGLLGPLYSLNWPFMQWPQFFVVKHAASSRMVFRPRNQGMRRGTPVHASGRSLCSPSVPFPADSASRSDSPPASLSPSGVPPFPPMLSGSSSSFQGLNGTEWDGALVFGGLPFPPAHCPRPLWFPSPRAGPAPHPALACRRHVFFLKDAWNVHSPRANILKDTSLNKKYI